MSLILEALRKSEAERRRGDAPDLRVELPPPAPPSRRVPRAAWLAAGALAACIALAALWPRGDDAGTAGGVGDTATAEQPGDAPPALQADADAAPAADPAAAFPTVDRIEPAATQAAPAPSAASPAHSPVAADDLPLAPPPMAQRAADEAAEDAAPPPPAGPAPPASASGIPRITELAPGERQRLPDMKLSMHMWNEDPARRFAVIDGHRKIEGDRVGEATIAAIDREGLVLDLDGRRIRVPLP